MTPAGMVAMRLAATLAHTLLGVRVRLRDGEQTLVEVVRPPLPEGPAITPCAFRMAVAQAHEQIKAGARLAFLGMPDGTDPAVDIGVRSGDRVLPGGIYRVGVGDIHVHAFVTTLSPRACQQAGRDAGLLIDERDFEVRLHRDVATEVTLVHTVTPADDVEVRPVLEELLAACVADEVLGELAQPTRR